MLGKLTRWLRMMGHDVKYSPALEDDELMSIANEEKRILLTKDLELFQRCVSKGVEVFYVEGANEACELAELSERFKFPLVINLDISRCPKCNTLLELAGKEMIKQKVKPKTYSHYNEFWQCPRCGQVYWQGAHWDKIRATLRMAEEIAKE